MDQWKTDLLDRIKTPMNDWVLLRKCKRPVESGIQLDDYSVGYTNFFEVLFCGPDCKTVTNDMAAWCRDGDEHGETVLLPEADQRIENLFDEYWWARERVIVPVLLRDGELIPLADYVTFEPETVEAIGFIIVPELDQNNKARYGTVLRVGSKCRDILVGDKVFFGSKARFWRIRCNDKSVGIMRESKVEGVQR